jgi:hypothetical protein
LLLQREPGRCTCGPVGADRQPAGNTAAPCDSYHARSPLRPPQEHLSPRQTRHRATSPPPASFTRSGAQRVASRQTGNTLLCPHFRCPFQTPRGARALESNVPPFDSSGAHLLSHIASDSGRAESGIFPFFPEPTDRSCAGNLPDDGIGVRLTVHALASREGRNVWRSEVEYT